MSETEPKKEEIVFPDAPLGKPLLKMEDYPLAAAFEPGKKLKWGRPVGSKDKKPRKKRLPSAIDANNAAAMYAIGLSKNKITQILNISHELLNEILGRPEVREFAIRVRDAIRTHSLASVQQVNVEAFNWLQEIAKDKTDSKAFDYLTRGLAALEKVASSTSGETQKVAVQAGPLLIGELSEEAKELVKALTGDNESRSK